jgi:hypothetical protein
VSVGTKLWIQTPDPGKKKNNCFLIKRPESERRCGLSALHRWCNHSLPEEERRWHWQRAGELTHLFPGAPDQHLAGSWEFLSICICFTSDSSLKPYSDPILVRVLQRNRANRTDGWIAR